MSTAAAAAIHQPASSRAIASLVIGIVTLVTGFWIFSPIAWYLGSAEIDEIRRFRAPANGHDFAQVGRILGIIGTIPILFVAVVCALAVPIGILCILFG
ncbi:MAG: DUF4190 domain-containing protein [Acidobacteriota bacterium]